MKRTQKTFSQQTSHTGILAQLLRWADAFGKTNQPPALSIMSFDVPFLPLLLSLLEKDVCRQKGTPLFRQCLLPFLVACLCSDDHLQRETLQSVAWELIGMLLWED